MAVKRYDGSAWQVVAGKGDQGTSSSISTWVKTASGGETSLSGNDDNSQSLSYTVGQELVFINGTLLKRGSDYTATNGTSITGLTALAANDVATVWTVNAFSVTNAISNTLVDAKGDLVTASGADVPARLAVGTNGHVLTADSTTGTGLKWAAVSTPAYVGALAYFFSSQNLTSGVAVVLTFTNEGWDTNSFHDNSTNTSRMTIPSGYGGKYLVQIVASVTTGTDTSIRLLKNGANISSRGLNSSQLQQHVNTGGNTLQHSASFVIDVSAGDYLEAALVANAASKVVTDASFSVSYLGA